MNFIAVFNLLIKNKPGHLVVCRHRGWICLWCRVAGFSINAA